MSNEWKFPCWIANIYVTVESDKREADPTAGAEPSKKKLAPSPDHPVPMVGVQPSGSDHSWGGGQRLGDDGEEQEEEAMGAWGLYNAI